MTADLNTFLADLTHPGMGTENTGPLLAGLVRMTRPERILEVGAGSTTLHLLSGLADAVDATERDRRIVAGEETDEARAAVLHPGALSARYEPRLLVVDDLSVAGTTAADVVAAAAKLGLAHLLEFLEQDFFTIDAAALDAHGPFDLVWLDAGGQADDARFLTALWPRLRPGGLVAVHEPVSAAVVRSASHSRPVLRTVPTPLIQALRRQTGPGSGFEMLTLAEPHKFRQAGLTLLRKLAGWERDRGASFGSELAALGEDERVRPPVLTSEGAVLTDPVCRRVHAAVVLGAALEDTIAARAGVPAAEARRALHRLLASGLVRDGDGVWRDGL
ncbi:hypothetical protein GCM10010112_75530 [Actinoplanes lobatus]|uniref:Putative O-methyltransferase YrrM n=1 Tax=Actinoplanes lobatus TaxID=113568 RepID=A0A7W7HH72_9ACTN|nr:class I SAM-dependent methyltransferase [Actinoplanes lobatus]MBB4750504.1 putative O-methyltransferase YrrM [Actinoplanes lobatus]GGN90278.1 hypothetical protein GCM10010112_75530 [Actinoplanes lobatus]GIE43819.1 hypothetical protein Alo02nite_67170 [Actinoplanes lobatus]